MRSYFSASSRQECFRKKKTVIVVLRIHQERSYYCRVGKQEKNMGEINLPASAPKAFSDSLELGRNSSSVQVVPSVFFMGHRRPFLQHLAAEAGRDTHLD